MEKINKTGLTFNPGQTLSASNLSTMNNVINSLVDAVNYLLTSYVNINAEVGNFTQTFTLETAIATIGDTKRALGMKIRFLTSSGKYEEYVYTGTSLADLSFSNVNNWKTGFTTIDGGSWE